MPARFVYTPKRNPFHKKTATGLRGLFSRSHKKTARRRRPVRVPLTTLLFGLGAIAGFGLFLWGFFFSPLLRIQYVAVSGLMNLNAYEVESAAQRVLQQHVWFLPQNLITLHSKNLEVALRSTFPRIRDVQISRHLPERRLAITIGERKESGIWCRTVPPSPPCFFFDDEGFVFGEAPAMQGSLLFVYAHHMDENISIGAHLFAPEYASSMARFRDAVQATLSTSLTMASPEVDGSLRFTSDAGWSVIVPFDGHMERYSTILTAFFEKGINAQDKSRIDRIDLRIPDRISYTVH